MKNHLHCLVAAAIVVMSTVGTSGALTDDQYTRSVVSQGNLARLHHVFDKGQNGEPLVIGAIGGSITWGATSSTPYATRVAQWWTTTFPSSSVVLKNAGIGGTTSLYGVHRVAGDLLVDEPDFVVVEFAVNDGSDDSLWSETMEGLLRQILKSPKTPAVLILFFMVDDGRNAQTAHMVAGTHYQVPMISYRDAFWPDIQSGQMLTSTIFSDGVHPNDTGHEYAAELVNHFMAQQLQEYDGQAEAIPPTPSPVISDIFEFTRRCAASWAGTSEGDQMYFVTPDPCRAITLYQIGGDANAGHATVAIDGIFAKDVCSYWDASYAFPWIDFVTKDLSHGTHTVIMTVTDEVAPGGTGNRVEVSEILMAGLGSTYWTWASAITNGLSGYNDSATGDGYPNLLKYATGSSPTISDGLARLSIAGDESPLQLLFNRNTHAVDVTMYLETSEDLTNGSWVVIATNRYGTWAPNESIVETGAGSTVGVSVTAPAASGAKCFYRLRVTSP